MSERVVSGSLWINKLGEVVKVTSVARTPEEVWISFSHFGDPRRSSTLSDSAFLQRYKPYNISYGS